MGPPPPETEPPGETTSVDRFGRWRWIGVPAALAIASRAFSIGVVLVESAIFQNSRANVLAPYDGGWYLGIVANGYHAEGLTLGAHDFSFFPAWPAVIRVGTLGLLPADLIAVFLANVLFVLAAIVIWRLLGERFGEAVATPAIALLAFAPAAYVFSMAYSESLFLAVAASYFIAPSARLKGLLGALGSLTRLAGVALGATSAVMLPFVPKSRRSALLVGVAGSAIGLAAWVTFVAILTHDPLGLLQGSPAWVADRSRHLVALVELHKLRFAAWFLFTAIVAIGSALAWRRDRELGVYSLGMIAIAVGAFLVVPSGSLARYALPAFPAFAGLAAYLGRRTTLALVVAFAIGQIVFVAWTMGPGAIAP